MYSLHANPILPHNHTYFKIIKIIHQKVLLHDQEALLKISKFTHYTKKDLALWTYSMKDNTCKADVYYGYRVEYIEGCVDDGNEAR